MTRIHFTVALTSLGLLMAQASGCDRDRMNDEYGRRSREFFARQHVYQEPTAGSPHGLDSEEAALIHANYRATLGAEEKGGGSGNENSRVLLIEEPKHGSQPR